ncbi:MULTISPECIES: retropepsin-like aspartic protease [Okeania]|uniref:Clan AA aspartic protease n=1 Tax=Okeania hirsuta TaxID=1458930 RepID=A0A3N6PYH7_9CYAN|nr:MULTISPECIES: retropepsin-like aspartic protease [Okeania]NES75115.1 clan AA aspartic protease [Okeania sp. SIO1H4]NES89455.1 clan AA aspartic protease [Okeania sp. SIO2B9]NET22281.1 clan AA aspartic protease [Okeania sp. SIO1H5]NET78138.1 clan AA aspartic protease [Okeania sp. SIO1F9]NET93741.1 clan AA aspartic protease [Okeania sp. SIO1H2]
MNKFWSIIAIIFSSISCPIFIHHLVISKPIIFSQNLAIANQKYNRVYGNIPKQNIGDNRELCVSPEIVENTIYKYRKIGAIVELEGLNLPRPKVTGKATIPFQFLTGGKAFTLTATLGKRSGNFLLDTGASTSIIATETVKELGLTGKPVPQELLTYAVAGDECPEMKANLHRLPVLKIDNVKVEGLTVLEFTTTIMPDGLSGVLGMDILSNFDVEIHPQTQELKLLPPTPIPTTNIDDAIPLKAKLGVVLAEVEINGKGPFIFMLDTGAESIFISQKLANQLNISAAERQEIRVQGFCGIEMAEYASLAKVKMGNYQLTNLETVILSSPVLKLLEVDGILGQNFLNNYQQYWRFNQKNPENFPADGSLLLTP